MGGDIDILQTRNTDLYIAFDSTPSPVFIVSRAQVKCYSLTTTFTENGPFTALRWCDSIGFDDSA